MYIISLLCCGHINVNWLKSCLKLNMFYIQGQSLYMHKSTIKLLNVQCWEHKKAWWLAAAIFLNTISPWEKELWIKMQENNKTSKLGNWILSLLNNHLCAKITYLKLRVI